MLCYKKRQISEASWICKYLNWEEDRIEVYGQAPDRSAAIFDLDIEYIQYFIPALHKNTQNIKNEYENMK